MIFDINNPPSTPDSSLDSAVNLTQLFTIEDSTLQPIAPGDWVDVDPSCLNKDINWSYSFQVCNVYPNVQPGLQAVGILVSNDNGETYEEVQLSASWITNNFRRVPRQES